MRGLEVKISGPFCFGWQRKTVFGADGSISVSSDQGKLEYLLREAVRLLPENVE
jgi:hypothetical protein